MRTPRTRNIIASVLGVLAVLLLVVGTVAIWARVTVTSSERVADLAVDAFDEAEVQAALSDYITNLVFTAVDVDAALTAVLPDQLQSLEPLLAGGAADRRRSRCGRAAGATRDRDGVPAARRACAQCRDAAAPG